MENIKFHLATLYTPIIFDKRVNRVDFTIGWYVVRVFLLYNLISIKI